MDHYRTTTRDYSHYSYGPLLRTATMDHWHGPLLQTTARDSLLRQRPRLRLLITNYRPLTTDYWLLTTDYWTLTTDWVLLLTYTDYRLLTTAYYWLATTHYWLLTIVLPTDYRLPTTDYLTTLATNYRPPSIWLPTTDDWVPTTDYWLLTTDYWLLTTDNWLLATGYWRLTTEYWLLPTDYSHLTTLTTDYWLLTADCPLLFAMFNLFMPCHAMIYFAMLRHAWLCFEMLCLAVLSFALLWFRGRLVSLSRFSPKMQEIHTMYAASWPQSQIPWKNVLFRPLFDPNHKFIEKMSFSDRFMGGDHGRARKMKSYNKNRSGNHNEKSRDDFWSSGPGNRWEIVNFYIFAIKMVDKMRVRTNPAREK